MFALCLGKAIVTGLFRIHTGRETALVLEEYAPCLVRINQIPAARAAFSADGLRICGRGKVGRFGKER
jgi:hypothetical protein